MTIRQKLILGFSSLIVLMATGSVIGNSALLKLKADAREAMTVGDRLNAIALEIQVHNLEAQRRVKGYLTDVGKLGPAKARETYLEEADFEISEMQTLATRAVKLAPTPEKRATFTKVNESLAAYTQARDNAVAASEKAPGSPEADAAATQYMLAADKLHDNAEDGEVAGRDASQTSESEIERTSSQAIAFSIGLSLVALLAGIVMSVLILRAIVHPVNHLKEVAENVSMGNLQIQVKRFSEDEIGDLSDSFGRMLTAVRYFRMEAAMALEEATAAEKGGAL